MKFNCEIITFKILYEWLFQSSIIIINYHYKFTDSILSFFVICLIYEISEVFPVPIPDFIFENSHKLQKIK